MSDGSIVAGVFREKAQAEHTLDILRNAGFDQIGFAMPDGFGMMNGRSDTLLSMGIPEEEASYYESELSEGRSIVFVRHDGRLSEVFNILILNGSRIHRFLHSGKPGATHVSVPHAVLSSKQPERSVALESEQAAEDELAALHRLLKNAGLDQFL